MGVAGAKALSDSPSVNVRDIESGKVRATRELFGAGEVQFYTGGQTKNQAVSTTETRAAALLPLTTLSAMQLTVREALIVATAASVATITNATAIIRKIRSIIPVH